MPATAERTGFAKVILWLFVVFNSLTAALYTFAADSVARNATVPIYYVDLLNGLVFANLVFIIGLFRWQKWAFWGICVNAALALAINTRIGVPIGQSLLGLSGVALLYGALRSGGDRNVWERLR